MIIKVMLINHKNIKKKCSNRGFRTKGSEIDLIYFEN